MVDPPPWRLVLCAWMWFRMRHRPCLRSGARSHARRSEPMHWLGAQWSGRLDQWAQGMQIALGRTASLIDREVDRPGAEALQYLPEAADSPLAFAAHTRGIDLDRHHLGPVASFVQDIARWVDDDRTPGAAVADAVHLEKVALVDRRIGTGNPQLDAAIEGVRHRRVQDHFRAERDKLPRRFRKPHVVADRDSEAPDVRHVEYDELGAWLDPGLVRLERKHLPVSSDHLAARIDDGHRVVDALLATLEHRAGDQPEFMARRHLAKRCLGGPRHGLRVLRRGTERAEFAEQHHLHPRKPQHEQVEALAHRGDVLGLGRDGHLDSGDRNGYHRDGLRGA